MEYRLGRPLDDAQSPGCDPASTWEVTGPASRRNPTADET